MTPYAVKEAAALLRRQAELDQMRARIGQPGQAILIEVVPVGSDCDVPSAGAPVVMTPGAEMAGHIRAYLDAELAHVADRLRRLGVVDDGGVE